MNIKLFSEKIENYIKSQKSNVHENIIYCFKNEYLKDLLKPTLLQGNPQVDNYTEIFIEEENIYHKNSPIFLYGEYIKLSREMTQTPLKIKGKLKCKRSVSDFINQIKEHYKSKDVKFIPSGREDIDVKMIGGRPFLLKVVEPTCNLFNDRISLHLYDNVKIQNFMQVTKDIKKLILCGEKEENKVYRLFIASKKEIIFEKEYKLLQKTPLRVLHRRANLVRKKYIEILETNLCKDLQNDFCYSEDLKKEFSENILPVDFYYYTVILKASAGTYIKEFVHGDLGRTCPSLSTNYNLCDLLFLDVLKVEKKIIDSSLIIRKIQIK